MDGKRPLNVLERGAVRRRRWRLPLAVVMGLLAAFAAILLLTKGNLTQAQKQEVQQTTAQRTKARHFPSPGFPADRRFSVHVTGSKNLIHPRFKVFPKAALLFNLKTGRVLYRRRPQRRYPIASLTKMMTAVIIAELADPHQRVLITKQAKAYKGSGVGVLPRGKKVQLEALFNGLMLVSGNDAAIALAQHVAGTVGNFVQMMNLRADQLGMSRSHFNTPHGFVDKGNYSTAQDLATLARADMAQPRIRTISRRRQAAPRFPIKGGRLFIYNNNPLIRLRYRGATGLKTGYTDRSGKCFVATAKRGTRHLGVVLIDSPDIYTQARRLLDLGFRYGR